MRETRIGQYLYPVLAFAAIIALGALSAVAVAAGLGWIG
jgi:hypothetical protein